MGDGDTPPSVTDGIVSSSVWVAMTNDPRPGGLPTTQTYFSVLEASGLTSGSDTGVQGETLLRVTGDCLLTVSSQGREQTSKLSVSSRKGTNPFGGGSTLVT